MARRILLPKPKYPTQLTWKNFFIAGAFATLVAVLSQIPEYIRVVDCEMSAQTSCELVMTFGNAALSMLALPVFVIILKYLKRWKWADIGFGKIKVSSREVLKLILIGFGLIFVLTVILNLLATKIPVLGEEQFTFTSRTDVLLFSVFAVGIAPFAEELIFRGFLLSSIGRRFGFIVGALASSAIFGLAHGNPAAVFVTFVLGLYMSWLFARTQSLWPSVLLHLCNNLAAVVVLLLTIK